MNARCVTLLSLAVAVAVTACRSTPESAEPPAPVASPPAGQTQVFQVDGVVKQIRSEGRIAVIRHEEIPGYMAAMTMPFAVKDPQETAGLTPGDAVSFRMTVTETDGWIDQIRVRAKGQPEDTKPDVPPLRIVRDVEELKEGDVMPDYPLVTESRRAIRLHEYRGQVLGFTFIYTRCPYPTFCPRQSRQFVEAAVELRVRLPGPNERWHLLAISFDPAYDTPAVLQKYARQQNADPEWLSFCTTEMIEIDAITEQFGMFFARDGEGFSHNVRTVVVGPEGRIRKIFVGNEWTTTEFVNAMIEAARTP